MKWIIFNSNLLHGFRFISRYGGHRISSLVLHGFEDDGVYMCVYFIHHQLVSQNTLFLVVYLTGSFATCEDRSRAAF
jgi:hypothetical protein